MECDPSEEDIGQCASFLLRPMIVADVKRSSILQDVFLFLVRWRSLLRPHWSFANLEDLFHVLRHATGCVLRLVDGSAALTCTASDASIDMIGLSLIRRLCGRTRATDYRDSAAFAFDVSGIRTLAFDADRFSYLVDYGVFDACDSVSQHGAIVTFQRRRYIAVPHSVGPSGILMAIASLLDVPVDAATPASHYRLDFGVVHSEPCANDARHELTPYRVRVASGGVTLVRDDEECCVNCCTARSVDEFAHCTISTEESRVRRSLLLEVFPLLAERIMRHGEHSIVRACVYELWCRRIVSEWTLECFDSGGNLSVLGGAVLLAVVIGRWLGARVRVFYSISGAAAFGVWFDGAWRLFNPAWTTENVFRDLVLASLPSRLSEFRRGDVVEVLFRTRWHVGLVLHVRMRLLRVHFYEDRSFRWVDTSTSLVRSLARDPERSDANSLVRRGMRR